MHQAQILLRQYVVATQQGSQINLHQLHRRGHILEVQDSFLTRISPADIPPFHTKGALLHKICPVSLLWDCARIFAKRPSSRPYGGRCSTKPIIITDCERVTREEMEEQWRRENREEIERVWRAMSTGAGLCAMCDVCGGSSISNCQCARKRFMTTVTREQLERYKRTFL